MKNQPDLLHNQRPNVPDFYQAHRNTVENRPAISSPKEANRESQSSRKEKREGVQSRPILVTQGKEATLIIRFPFSAERVAKIKTIGGRLWHANEKYWTVPSSDGAIARLHKLFAGEPVEIDPASESVRAGDSQNLAQDSNLAPIQTLLDRVHQAIRKRHYSVRTDKVYVHWITRFIRFHQNRHPAQMSEAEVGQFLSNLAPVSHVSASTQNQALNAVVFLYREVLGKKIGMLQGVVRAKRPQRLPVVLTKEEVQKLL